MYKLSVDIVHPGLLIRSDKDDKAGPLLWEQFDVENMVMFGDTAYIKPPVVAMIIAVYKTGLYVNIMQGRGTLRKGWTWCSFWELF